MENEVFVGGGTQAAERPVPGMRKDVTSGAILIGFAQAVRLVIQILSVVILSRLLQPSDFGLYAMATPVLAVAMLLQDPGVSQAIIQRKTLSPHELNALFWVNLAIGLGVAAVLAVVAPAVGMFYHEAVAARLTFAIAAIVIAASLGVQHQALLNRGMRFATVALIDGLSAVAGLTASIAVAVITHSVWALFAGSLAASLIPTLVSWIMVPWRPSFRFDLRPAQGVLKSGAGVTGFNLTNFFARNLDNILIGRRWGQNGLGAYDRAYKLLLLPLQQVNNPISRVMLPALSRMVDQPVRYKAAFFKSLSVILIISVPGVIFMTVSSTSLVPLLLGHQWSATAPIFAALGFAGMLQSLNNPCGWLFISQARTWAFMKWGCFNAVTCAVSFVVGLPYGPYGVAIAYAIGEAVRTPFLWWYVTKHGPISVREATAVIAPFLAAAVAAFAISRAIYLNLPAPTYARLAVTLIAAYAFDVAALLAFPQGRWALRQATYLVIDLSDRARAAAALALSRSGRNATS